MIVQERPVPFSKSRHFFGPFLGDYYNPEILKSVRFIGFEVSNVAAWLAATH